MIRKGRSRSASCHPVALAINEVLRDGLIAGVNWEAQSIDIWGPDPVERAVVIATVSMPEAVRKLSHAFSVFGRDLVAWGPPVDFELDIPQELLR
jgi:hypothetical protein